MVKLLTNVLLPLLVFSYLTFVAINLIFHQSLLQTDLQSKLSSRCDPDLASHPFPFAYTNNSSVDGLLCGLIVFFQAFMGPAYHPLLAVFFSVVGVAVLILFLEASRDRRSFAVCMPTAVGVLWQVASIGVIMPIYAFLFVSTGTASIRPSVTPTQGLSSKINQGNAEALLFGMFLGYVLPTVLMLYLVHPHMTAIWQCFPLPIALAIFAHKIIRPPSRHVQSGHITVVVTLGSAFVLSALLYAIYVWPVLTDSVTLRTLFVPVAGVSDPTATSLEDDVLELIKWDLIFGTGSVVLATFWMADSMLSLIGILAWYGITTIALGPAAAIAGVLLWRERRLNGQSTEHKAPQKTE